MGLVNEAMSKHVTLSYLAGHYDLELQPESAGGVTVTSVTDDVDRVRPGSLLLLPDAQEGDIETAMAKGAYAVVLGGSWREKPPISDIPVLYGDPTGEQIGAMASDMAGSPSTYLAVFAVAGSDADEVHATVIRVADFLHMLGNPVAVISSAESRSLERRLLLHYPIGSLDVQNTLSVSVEDGAAAVVIALDDETLRLGALDSLGVDVLGCVDAGRQGVDTDQMLSRLRDGYGFELSENAQTVGTTAESDELAEQSGIASDPDGQRRLSLAIAMALGVGVRRSTIRGALKVSKELR
ncbi:UDP-N-acetylmuramyl peptide synthase [uncultured Bifidobacterium sp.]|uniref:UDP-N-acetylmuramyl peptide synthase n=1 Tax=uncultured Bifidobacterium sp. TaxID=165187 RepID=UPI002639C3B6|nr:UDP-N-acetylmuramyl peptide synthase [uncultured Bifidobacterium sp.]